MKTSKNIEHYKAKIIELADKLQEKEKECSYLKELSKVHEKRIINLEKQLNNDKRYKDLIEHIEQQNNEITSLIEERNKYKDLFESLDTLVTEKQFEINGLQHKLSEVADMCIRVEKQRDNYKNDYEYAEECFQAERNKRWELEEQVNKIKDTVSDKNEFYSGCLLKLQHAEIKDCDLAVPDRSYPFLMFKIEENYSKLYVFFDFMNILEIDTVSKDSASSDNFKLVYDSTTKNGVIKFKGKDTYWISNYKLVKVQKSGKYNLNDYEIVCVELHDTENKQIFFVKDKIKHESILISDVVESRSLSEYTLVPTLMETFDILQVQRFDGKSVTNKYIDLLTNKVYNDHWYTIVEERGKK